MDDSIGTAIYLAGHGSKTKPRLIELQYHRILRYRRALLSRYDDINRSVPAVFIDLHLPGYGAGHVTLNEVPRFVELWHAVEDRKYDFVFIDIDEVRQGLTPDHESAFVRTLLEEAGAQVLNAFCDDRGAFREELKARCGPKAQEDDVTDGSDFVGFFPSLAAEITATALRRELQDASAEHTLERINMRVEGLQRLRPYAGGTTPFIEDRLASEWQKLMGRHHDGESD
jgi:hypothetical protein